MQVAKTGIIKKRQDTNVMKEYLVHWQLLSQHHPSIQVPHSLFFPPYISPLPPAATIAIVKTLANKERERGEGLFCVVARQPKVTTAFVLGA